MSQRKVVNKIIVDEVYQWTLLAVNTCFGITGTHKTMGDQNSKLRPEIADRLAEKTGFSEQEVQAWFKCFVRDCPSGALSLDKFRNIYTGFFPNGDSAKFAEFVFESFDLDRDGLLNFEEFIVALSMTSRGDLEDKLEWAFRMYDRDKDGQVSKKDMLEVIRAIYKMVGVQTNDNDAPKRRMEKVFKQVDKQKKGKLSFEEFVEGAKVDHSIVHLLECDPSSNPPPVDD